MSFTRRRLLASTGALASAALLDGVALAAPTPRGVIVGGQQALNAVTGAKTFALRALTEEGEQLAAIGLPFHFHGFAGNPVDRRYAALFEKQGPGAGIVDLATSKLVRTLPPARGRLFYGHGAYSPDAKLLYATETIPATMEGVISVRDGNTFEEIAHFRSHGTAPHDCHLIDDGKVMVVTHGGGTQGDGLDPPSVAWVDVRSEKLLEKVLIPSPRLNAGHVAVGKSGDIAVVSAPRRGLPGSEHGGITLRLHGAAPHTLSEPADVVGRFTGEVLSVAYHEPTRTVAATNPDGNLLTFWEIAQGKLRRSMHLDKPRGVLITPDGKWFAVTHGEQHPMLSFFSVFSLAHGKKDITAANLTGSHIYNWTV